MNNSGYYLGRNETLADAKSLQDADRAYLASDGSFKALLVSLLTSDSFLKWEQVRQEDLGQENEMQKTGGRHTQ